MKNIKFHIISKEVLQMLKLKKLLLDTNLVIDNQYLDEYVELIINNFDSKKIKNVTQEHHSIPVFCYTLDRINNYSNTTTIPAERRKEALKIANADPNNKRVHLTYSDHVKAHALLARCGGTYKVILSNANACILMLNLLHVAVDHNIVSDLNSDENIQTAYEYWASSIKPRPDPKDNPEYYKTVLNNLKCSRGITNKKIRCIETGVIYNSLREAEDLNGLTRHRLNQILTGRRKQIPGMTFEYYNETSEISEVTK